MKKSFLLLFLLFFYVCSKGQIENIIIVTTDGFRWQEVFKGLDSAIASTHQYNHEEDSHLFQKYWAPTEEERRKKLMPFLWTTIGTQGQLYGNRTNKVRVNVTNKYWFSYPGYSEMFCGFADKKVNSNNYGVNPNSNVLEFINKQPGFEGKVAAFGAWNAFDRIFNEGRCGFPVVSGGDSCGGQHPDAIETDINSRKKTNPNPFDSTEYADAYTHEAAVHYLQKNKPRVLFIGYGETDLWAHYGQYATYINAAHQLDAWLNDLWARIQNDPFYKDKTALFITVDHGRGDRVKKEWTNHNRHTKGSNEIWFGVIGPGIAQKGEIKKPVKLKQKQFAQTWAELLKLNYKDHHKVAKGFRKTLTTEGK
jgi:hypothetical protein